MKKKSNSFLYFFASVLLIGVAIISSAVINRLKDSAAGDIRARAGATNILKFTGTVISVNEGEGTLVINNLQFDPESRSGPPQDYGTWTVTVPTNFNLSQAFPGVEIALTVEPKSFNVITHHVVASQVQVK